MVEGTVVEIQERCEPFGIGHGLVGFKPNGEVGVKIEGHKFGKPEVIAKIDALLAMN